MLHRPLLKPTRAPYCSQRRFQTSALRTRVTNRPGLPKMSQKAKLLELKPGKLG